MLPARIFFNRLFPQVIWDMTLWCPFCHAPEEERVNAVDVDGNKVLLVMFDCPFHFTFALDKLASEDRMQEFLEDWKSREGESWLESVGPVMKAREMKNMSRYESSRRGS